MTRGAGLLIFKPDGLCFLIRRSILVADPGAWDVPGGGVEPGESAIDTAIREGEEETGGLPVVHIFGSFEADGYTTFFASVDQNEADFWRPPLSHESDQYGWFDPAEPPTPLRPNVRTVLEHIVA